MDAAFQKKARNKELLFSVIMPCFNVGGLFEDAIDDILSQTYPRWELILVDDASTDNTAEVGEVYARSYEAVTLLRHDRNRGVSSARNTGLEQARGDYVLFLDPDDRYEETLLEVISDALSRQASDVVVFGLEEDYYRSSGRLFLAVIHSMPTAFYNTRSEEDAPSPAGVMAGADSLHRTVTVMERETLYGYAWNKAYRRALLEQHEILFQRFPHIEDILFNLSFFEHVETMILLEDVLYHYQNRGQDRLTDRYQPNYFLLQKTRCEEFLAQQERWGVCDDSVLAQTADAYFRSLLSFIERELAHRTSRSVIEEKVRKEQATPLFARLAPALSGNGPMKRFFYRPLAEGKVRSVVHRAGMVAMIRRFFPALFVRLKQYRG